jgi:outer membrane protein OmpA-like peptidoglycan-associated protein
MSVSTQAQSSFLEGTWQGIKVNLGQENTKGKAIWFDLKIKKESKEVTGSARIETPFTEYYAVKTLKGELVSQNEIEFHDVRFGNKKNSGRSFWCLLKGRLIYSEDTGYLTCDFSSPDCRSNVGKITMYKSQYKMSMTDTVSMYHSWFNNFTNDLSRGWKAFYVRDAEMKNFQFRPVYFEHDKDCLDPEFHVFLVSMVKIIKSHTDLRIKIIGHTDSNGSDSYNVDLSKRRAAVIKQFLVNSGLKEGKVVVEFRGEKDPAANNATFKGKKLNRRVDFEFI